MRINSVFLGWVNAALSLVVVVSLTALTNLFLLVLMLLLVILIELFKLDVYTVELMYGRFCRLLFSYFCIGFVLFDFSGIFNLLDKKVLDIYGNMDCWVSLLFRGLICSPC